MNRLVQEDQVHRPQAADPKGPGRLHSIADLVSKLGPTVLAVAMGLWVAFEYMAHNRYIADAKLKAFHLERQQQKIDISYSKVPLLSRWLTLSAEGFEGSGEYEVTARLEIRNESRVPIEVVLTILDCYIASSPDEWRPEDHDVSIVALGSPSGRSDLKGHPGALKWQDPVLSVAGINNSADVNDYKRTLDGIVPVINSLGCSDLKPGGKTIFSETFLVKAPIGSYFSVVVTAWQVSGAEESDDGEGEGEKKSYWRTSSKLKLW